MKNKNGFGLVTLVIVGVATLIIGLLIGTQISVAQFSPTSPTRLINAHQCNTDGVCEVNILQANASARINDELIVTEGVGIGNIVSEFEGTELFIRKPSSIADLVVDGWENNFILGLDQALDSIVAIRGSSSSILQLNNNQMAWNFELTNSSNNLVLRNIPANTPSLIMKDDGFIELPSLAGNNNAYACLDSNGQLFRSQEPCLPT